MSARRIFRVSGKDTDSFLQGLITNDMDHLSDGMLYAAMLTPQGKYIADFLLVRDGDDVLLDVAESLADDLTKRLNMYKLRADVTIGPSGLNLQRGTGPAPSGAYADPRHADMGWRAYSDAPESDDGSDWDAIRVQHCIPESGIELTPNAFILETCFERLNGVDFRKGCYVGQEVTARMKHKTELRKGLQRVALSGAAAVGTAITRNGKDVGTLFTQSGDHALAYLRLDRAGDGMVAGDASLNLT